MLITRLHQLGKIAQFSETIIEQAIRNNQNDSPAKQNRKCVSCGSEFEVVKDLKIMGRTFRSSQDMCPTCEKKEHDKKVMVCLKETLKGRL
jgi:ribosomal protein S14